MMWSCFQVDVRRGARHVCHVLLLATLGALVGVTFGVAPSSAAFLLACEELLRLRLGEGGPIADQTSSMNAYTWTPEFLRQVPDWQPFLTAIFSREAWFLAVAWFGFGLVAYRGVQKEEASTKKIFLLRHCSAFVAGLGAVATFNLSYLLGLFHTSMWAATIVRTIMHAAIWCPSITVIFALLFPKKVRPAVLKQFVICFSTSIVIYFVWRNTCMTYFTIQDSRLRILIGIMVPWILGTCSFQMYLSLANLIHEHWGFHAAVLMLMIPCCYTIAISAVLQFGSTDLLSGVLFEIGGTILEVSYKRCLASGVTPVDKFIMMSRRLRTRGRCGGRRTARLGGRVGDGGGWRGEGKMSAIVPSETFDAHIGNTVEADICPEDTPQGGECNPAVLDPSTIGKVTTQLQASGTSREPGDSSDEIILDTPESRQWLLLASIAMHSNTAELIIQIMAASFYVLGMVNPNAPGEPPLDIRRVLLLLFLKVAFECISDFFFAGMVPNHNMASLITSSYAEAGENWSIKMQVDVCLLAILWCVESQTFFLQFLCPSVMPEGTQPGVLRSFYGLDQLLSIGMCN